MGSATKNFFMPMYTLTIALFSALFFLLSCGGDGDLSKENSDGSGISGLESYDKCYSGCLKKDVEAFRCEEYCSDKSERGDTDCEDGDKAAREDRWYLCKDNAWYSLDDKEETEDKDDKEYEDCEAGEQVEKDGVTYVCNEDDKWVAQ